MGAKTRDEWTKVGGRSFRPDSLERQSRFLWQGQVTVPVYCQRLWRKSIAFTQDVFKEHSCLLGWLWLQERSLSTLFLFCFFFLQWLCSQNSLLEGLWLMQGPTGRCGPQGVSSPHTLEHRLPGLSKFPHPGARCPGLQRSLKSVLASYSLCWL